jgi:hypothetical protein
MFFLQSHDLILILLLSLLQLAIPMFVELLVLLNVSLFTFLSLLIMQKDQLLHLTGEVLFSELINSIFSHLGFHISTFTFTSSSMLFHCGTKDMLILNDDVINGHTWILECFQRVFRCTGLILDWRRICYCLPSTSLNCSNKISRYR